jgi:hypothetical protein
MSFANGANCLLGFPHLFTLDDLMARGFVVIAGSS